jgi:two-component sensor histidine kinase
LIYLDKILAGTRRQDYLWTQEVLMDKNADLVAEANHRAANSLALLGGLVRMQARAIGKNSHTYSNAEIRLLFDGIAARIATIGQLHRLLATLPTEGPCRSTIICAVSAAI